MALWSGLGQAATVAQLVGVDLGGLISNIMQAAATARQNKKECKQLAERVSMIDELLSQMQDCDEMMQRLLTEFENTLRKAHQLIVSCQERSAAYRFVMAKRQADDFRYFQSRIDNYLALFSMASNIVIMRRCDENYNALNPTGCTTVPCTTYAGVRSQPQYQPWDEEEEEQRATFYTKPWDEEEDQGAVFCRDEEECKAVFYREEEDQGAVFYREKEERKTIFYREEEDQGAVFYREEEQETVSTREEEERETAFYREEEEQEIMFNSEEEEEQNRMFNGEEEREHDAGFYREDEDEKAVFYRKEEEEEEEEGNTGAPYSWEFSMHFKLPLIVVHGRICSAFVRVNQP